MTTPAIATAPVRLPANPYLQKAVNAEVPEYRPALELEQQADELLRNLPAVPPVPEELDPYRTGEITDEWMTAVRAHEAAVAESEARRRILIQFRQKATTITSGILEGNWNRLLGVLHRDLMTILDVTASISRELGPASTAQQAIATNAGDAWKRLSGLADEYESVRAAQEWIVLRLPRTYIISSRPSLGGEEHASDLYLRNLDELWPAWRNPNAVARTNIDGTKDRLEPWPADPTARLLWMVRSEAQPWIPTTFNLDQLWRERRHHGSPDADDDAPALDQTGNPEPYSSLLAGPARPQSHRIAEKSEINSRRAAFAQLKGTQ